MVDNVFSVTLHVSYSALHYYIIYFQIRSLLSSTFWDYKVIYSIAIGVIVALGASTIIILMPLTVVFKAFTIALRVGIGGRCGGVDGDALTMGLHLGSGSRNLGSKTTPSLDLTFILNIGPKFEDTSLI